MRAGANRALAIGASDVDGVPRLVDLSEEQADALEARPDHSRTARGSSGQHGRAAHAGSSIGSGGWAATRAKCFDTG